MLCRKNGIMFEQQRGQCRRRKRWQWLRRARSIRRNVTKPLQLGKCTNLGVQDVFLDESTILFKMFFSLDHFYVIFHSVIAAGPTPSATSTSLSAESPPAASSWNCAPTSSLKPPRTSVLCAPERRDLDTPEAVSTASSPGSCAKEEISPTTMEQEESPSMETNSPMRTSLSGTPVSFNSGIIFQNFRSHS